MHKREIAFRVGGFDETLPKFIDWDMWILEIKKLGRILGNLIYGSRDKKQVLESFSATFRYQK